MPSTIVGFTSEAARDANVASGRISAEKAAKLPTGGGSSSSSKSTSSTKDPVAKVVTGGSNPNSLTTSQVKAIQKANGLTVDGIIGPNTQAVLSKQSSSSSSSNKAQNTPSNALFNPNNGQPLYEGQTATHDGITYTGTTPLASQDTQRQDQQTQNDTQDTNTTQTTGANQTDPNAAGATDINTGADGGQATSDSSSPSGYTRSLSQGSSGTDVANLQSALGIVSDGSFGPQTASAVKAFQLSHGLTADGVVGPQTMAALSASGKSADKENINAGFNTNGVDENGNKKQNQIPLTGDPTADALISFYNNQSPQKTSSEVMKEIFSSLGYNDQKSDFEKSNDEFSKLEDKKNDEIQDINNNPWYSEGVKQGKLKELDSKYEGKETILQNKLKMLETTISNTRADAQFIFGQTMDQLQQSSKLTEDIIFKAIDIAEKQSAAESVDTQVIDVGGRKVLINSKTGDTIKSLGASSSGTGSNNVATDNERALFTQFRGEPIVKDYNTILSKKLTVDNIINSGVGGPGDLAIVYEFMKGLDPSSVVRESEYDTAAKSGNIFAGPLAKFNGYFKSTGGFLPDSVKSSFQSIVNSKLAVQTQLYNNLSNEYKDIAKRQGLNPSNVVANYSNAASSNSGSSGTLSSGLTYTVSDN